MSQRSFRLSLLAATLLFVGSFSTPAQTDQSKLPHSMKGYELYSWETQKGWHFSLLVGTNRLKTYAEATSSTVRIHGLIALKKKLSQLPAGEEVFWASGRFRQMSRPPKQITDDLYSYAARIGIKLSRP